MNSHNNFALVFFIVSCLFLTYTNSEFRIINGVDWDIWSSPYLVAVNYSCRNNCVGSLISMQWVLTAAHCVYKKDANLFTIIAGVTDIRDLGATGQSRNVESAFHPDEYSIQTGIMDIALIEVSPLFDQSPTVEAISLCQTPLTLGTPMRVSGWGFTTNNGNPSPTLKSTRLCVTSFDLCAQSYRAIGSSFTQAMICAAGRETDTCNGDSGAPGVVHDRLCAVVSRNYRCNHPNYPSIFTNINGPGVRQFISIAGIN